MDGQSILFQWAWHGPLGDVAQKAAHQYVTEIIDVLRAQMAEGGDMLNLRLSGDHAIREALREATELDIAFHACAMMPVALAVLAVRVRSWPLLVPPVLCAAASVLLAYALVSFYATVYTVN